MKMYITTMKMCITAMNVYIAIMRHLSQFYLLTALFAALFARLLKPLFTVLLGKELLVAVDADDFRTPDDEAL